MKRWGLKVILLALSLLLIPSIASATEKPGATCPKLGKTTNISGARYSCVKSGKRLVWVKGIKINKPPSTLTSTSVKHKQVIVLPQLRSIDITAGPLSGLIAANSHLPVELSSTTPLVCAIQNQLVALLQTGTCAISATQAGNRDYLPADPLTYTFNVIPPAITSNNSLLEGVQTFVRVPKGSTYSSGTAEITLTTFSTNATAKVCANDSTAPGCSLVNGVGVADPASQTRYVEFLFHVKDLDTNPLQPISYRFLLKGKILDIDTGVTLQTLNNIDVNGGESADGSFFGIVPINLNLDSGYLIIDEGITDSAVRLLMQLSN